MSGTDEITASIEDYLLSLADSLQDAQQLLSQRQVSSLPGQPALTYQLPKLDFELKIALNIEQKNPNIIGDTLYLPLGASPTALPPITNKKLVSQAGTLHEHNVSTIKGSFVAVPVKQNLPSYEIELTEALGGGTQYSLTFLARQTNDGQVVSNVQFEINIEKERIANFNRDLLDTLINLDISGEKTEAEHVSEVANWFSLSESILLTNDQGQVQLDITLMPEDIDTSFSGVEITLPLYVLVGGNSQRFILPFTVA